MIPPSLDPFYAPPERTPGPGEVVRFRDVDAPTAVPATARQVVHGSTGTGGRPITVSGTVLVPRAPWDGPGQRPVLSYGVGVHGLGRDSAPSYLVRHGVDAEIPLLNRVLARNWAVAVTDGEGLGLPGPHTYGAGEPGGHAMLDVVRAAWRVCPAVAPTAPVLLWGYSEGGRCAVWAAERQPVHAPDLRLQGVAAGGVPADLRDLVEHVDAGPLRALSLGILIGLAHAHRDPALWSVLTDDGRAAAAHAAGLDAVRLIVEHAEPLTALTVRPDPWEDPAWRAVLAAERAGQGVPQVPVHLYHVVGDALVPASGGLDLAAVYRAAGCTVTWADVAAENHLAGAFTAAGDALDRLAGLLDPEPVRAARC